MLHAVRNPVRAECLDEGFTMLTGPAQDGTLLEIGVVDGDPSPVIVHEDRARRKYLPGWR